MNLIGSGISRRVILPRDACMAAAASLPMGTMAAATPLLRMRSTGNACSIGYSFTCKLQFQNKKRGALYVSS
jgi:hypothetical protein